MCNFTVEWCFFLIMFCILPSVDLIICTSRYCWLNHAYVLQCNWFVVVNGGAWSIILNMLLEAMLHVRRHSSYIALCNPFPAGKSSWLISIELTIDNWTQSYVKHIHAPAIASLWLVLLPQICTISSWLQKAKVQSEGLIDVHHCTCIDTDSLICTWQAKEAA